MLLRSDIQSLIPLSKCPLITAPLNRCHHCSDVLLPQHCDTTIST